MRLLAASLLLFPTIAQADTFPLRSPVSKVTIYPYGAMIVREVPFEVPAGQHQLVLLDMSEGARLEYIRVDVTGVRKDAVLLRTESVPPSGVGLAPDVQAAEERIEQVEEEIARVRDRAAEARLPSTTANVRARFLGNIGQSDTIGTADLDHLRALSQLIGEEVQAVYAAGVTAEAEARQIERALPDLERELANAKQARDALKPRSSDTPQLTVSVTAGQAATGTLTVTTFSDAAYWEPAYEAYLTRGDAPSLRLDRGALVSQETGEAWTDIDLTLSTVDPDEKLMNSKVWSNVRRVYTPKPLEPSEVHGEPVMEAPVVVEDSLMMTAMQAGYAVTYHYPAPITLASDADELRLELDSKTFEAELEARAFPRRDETAYLVAKLTNNSGEALLPSATVAIHVDGTFLGMWNKFAGIVQGDEGELPFGPIKGIRLEATVLNRNEAGRGIITRSNERSEEVRYEVRNLTDETWSVRVLGNTWVSEQEDLQVNARVTPAADETDVDDMKGVVAWTIDMAPGDTKTITLEQTMSWPEGMELIR